jgi:HlyD family secretion protein
LDRQIAYIEEANRIVAKDIVAHELADESSVYPRLSNILPDSYGLFAMSRAHREILHMARLLARLADGLTPNDADRYLIRDGQRIIESIESLVRIHNAQEEDIYENAGSERGAERRWLGAGQLKAPGGRDAVPSPASQSARKSGLGWQIPATAGVLLLALGGGWLTWSLYRGTTAHYVTQKLERGSVVHTVTASGVIGSTAAAPVGAHVSGVIQALYCHANMKVKEGQPCAKIDPRTYQIMVDQAKADLAAAAAQLEKDKVNLAQAQAAFERNQIREKRRAISGKALIKPRKAYEQAQTQMKRDEGMLTRLQAALRAAEINLGSTDIVSPIDGTIVSRNVEMSQTVAANSETPLFLVAADLTLTHIDAILSEKDIGEVKLGDEASISVASFPNHPFAGEVTQIPLSPRTNQHIATDVVISAHDPDLLLETGMAATIRIVIDRRDDVLRAPNQALRYSPKDLALPNGSGSPRTSPDDSSQLWILRDGKPRAITVQLGLNDGANTEIIAGDVQSGDELITGESGGFLEKPAAIVPPDPRPGKLKS